MKPTFDYFQLFWLQNYFVFDLVFLVGFLSVCAALAFPKTIASVLSPIVALSHGLTNRKRIILGFTYLVLLILLGEFVTQRFPNSADEVAVLYQAKTFMKGHLWNAEGPLDSYLIPYYVFVENGRVFAQYLPTWALVLAVGMKLWIPYWWITPICGVCLLALFHQFIRIRYSTLHADVSTIILAISPFFLFNAISLFSHMFCALCIMAAVLFLERSLRSPRPWSLCLLGFFLVTCIGTRSYTGTLLVIVLIPSLFNIAKRPKELLWLLFGALPPALMLGYYNFQMTGNPFIEPMVRIFFSDNPLNAIKTDSDYEISTTWFRLKLMFLFSSPIFFLLFLGQFGKDLWNRHWLPWQWMPVSLIFGYCFIVGTAGNQYGGRYYFEAFPFIVLGAVTFAIPLNDSNSPRRTPYGKSMLVIAVTSMLLFTIPLTFSIRNKITARTEVYREVQRQQIKDAVVIVTVKNVPVMGPRDLLVNDPNRANSVLYADEYVLRVPGGPCAIKANLRRSKVFTVDDSVSPLRLVEQCNTPSALRKK